MSSRSNCIRWAGQEYRRRLREWQDGGRQPGAEPYLVSRPTRLRIQSRWWFPEWLCLLVTDRIPHHLVGALDERGCLTIEGFVPADRAYSLTPVQALRVIWFRGHVVATDAPG